MHRCNSLRKCTNCQETGHYSILWTKPPKPQPLNDLNAILCNFCFGPQYGSECNKNKDSTSVTYYNRTKQTIRTSNHILLMPAGSNQPDLNIAQWLHDGTTLNDYYREMGNKCAREQFYFRLLDGHSVHDAKLIDGFLYIYKRSTWQLIILRGLQIQGMSAQNFFIQQAHDNTGHGGLDETYRNLTDKYHWKNSYSDVRKFVESCKICQATKSCIQKPVGLLTALTVRQRP